jgi:ParB family transcriptional regulator, chromosome partitioning protein
LSPLEQAVSIYRLHEQFSMSYRDIAKKLGKAETTISNIVRLLQLPKPAIEAMQKNQITEGHARAILALKTDENKQIELLNKIITQGITVRQAEEFVHESKSIQSTTRPSKIPLNTETQKMVELLEKSLNTKVYIRQKTPTSGSVTINFNTKKELEQFINKLRT